MWTIGLVSAMVVAAPLMIALGMRTRAEWAKRPGYSGRLAYKAPIYTALGITVAVSGIAVVCMLATVLNSLAMVGLTGIDYGALYLNSFAPALVTFVVFAGVKWYIFMLAKGKDVGVQFDALLAAVAVALAVALFITSVVALRSPGAQTTPFNQYQEPCSMCSSPYYQTPFKY